MSRGLWDWRVIAELFTTLVHSHAVILAVPLHDQARVERCVMGIAAAVLARWAVPAIHGMPNADARW